MFTDLISYSLLRADTPDFVGSVPSHWSVTQLRRFCRVFAGATPSRDVPEYWTNGTIPWINSGSVNRRHITSPDEYISEAGFANSSTKWIEPGGLVVALAGQGRTKGMVATVETRTTCNQSLAAIQPRREICSHDYLGYFLESRYRQIRRLVGDGLRDGLNLEHVKSFPVPLPPVHEQLSIVKYLRHAHARIDRTIAAKRKLIALLGEQKQVIIDQAVTRGLRQSVAAKDSGVDWLGTIPSHWDSRRVKYLLAPVDERSESGTEERLTVSSTKGVLPRNQTTVTMFEAATYVGHKLCWPEDLVINSLWAWGRGLGVSQYHGLVSTAYGVYRRKSDQLLPAYLHEVVRSRAFHRELFVQSRGVWKSRLQLSDERFLASFLPLPPLLEQEQIVRAAQKASAENSTAIFKVSSEIDLLREFRTRLTSDVVTGQVDVREIAATLSELADEVPVENDELLESDDPLERELDLASADE